MALPIPRLDPVTRMVGIEQSLAAGAAVGKVAAARLARA
jgi:hypothetical protein